MSRAVTSFFAALLLAIVHPPKVATAGGVDAAESGEVDRPAAARSPDRRGLPPNALFDHPDIEAADVPHLRDLFVEASEEFGIPFDVIAGLAWTRTSWTHRGGKPTRHASCGIMDLGIATSALRAAWLLGMPPTVVQTDARANIRGGAAILAAEFRSIYGDEAAARASAFAAWWPALFRFTGACKADRKRSVFGTLARQLAEVGVSLIPMKFEDEPGCGAPRIQSPRPLTISP